MAKFDTYQEVTDKIISLLEAGAKPWSAGWQGAGALQLPFRSTGQPYRGINVLLLWASAQQQGFTGRNWFTFKQAADLGASVRKGERSTRIVFFKKLERETENDSGETETHSIPMLRTYNVFNADQIDNLPDQFRPAPVIPAAGLVRDTEREAALRSCGATIIEQGGAAFYVPARDVVTMPDFERFHTGGDYLATLAHELCHWTGHKSRLARKFGTTMHSPDYAREELVAELGAAFINARLGIAGDHIDSHASYLQSWLKELAADKKLIFRAAAAAQAAADMVLANAGPIAGNAAASSLESAQDDAAEGEGAPARAAPAMAQLALF